MEKTLQHPFYGYVKKKDYLVCIDSDGCAMDTMDIKHLQCFGPCMVKEWELGTWKDDILNRWNQVNLYSMTRGINRFKALAIVLGEIHQTYKEIPDIEKLVQWTDTSDELSNAALSDIAVETGSICLKKALHWSSEVNFEIEKLPEASKVPFAGVKEGLAFVHKYADIAIVSSANQDAVFAEWDAHGLMKHVDIMLAQNAGSKAYCIEKLLEYGYENNHVMMTGDAPGDLTAAEQNHVFFYPILVSQEHASWNGIREAVTRLADGTFSEVYQKEFIEAFKHNLMA